MRPLAFLLALTSALTAQTITIAPAPVDRAALVVKVPSYPFKKDIHHLCAFDESGKAHPMQHELFHPQFLSEPERAERLARENSELEAIQEGQVPKDPYRQYVLTLGFVPAKKTIRLTVRKGEYPIKVSATWRGPHNQVMTIDGKECLTYRTANQPRPGISDDILCSLHPVRSPSGAVVTGDLPSATTTLQGRTTDLRNMQNNKARAMASRMTYYGLVNTGAVYTSFHGKTETGYHARPNQLVTLWESSNVLLYDIPGTPKPMVVFDLITEQACANKYPVKLAEYNYDSFGLLGPEEWNGKDSTRFLTSEGISDRKQADGTRVRWCYLGGKTSAGISGTAVLDYPDNSRFPMPLSLYPDTAYISNTSPKLGAFSIQPGKRHVTRYRFIVTDGEPDAKLFDACWNSLAHPAVVSVAK